MTTQPEASSLLRLTELRSVNRLVVILGAGVLALFLAELVFDSWARRYVLIGPILASYLVAQLYVPDARFSLDVPLSPVNWARAAFVLQIVAINLLILTVGPTQGELPSLPSDSAMNGALILEAIAYFGFLGGLSLFHRYTRTKGRPLAAIRRAGILKYVVAFAVAGSLGVAFRFQSLENLINYFALQCSSLDLQARSLSGLAKLAESSASLLLPALGFAAVLLATRHLDRLHEEGPTFNGVAWLLFTVALQVVGYAVHTYNRAAVVVPLVALLSAFSLTARQLSLRVIGPVILVLLVLALAFGSVRPALARCQAAGPPDGTNISQPTASPVGPGTAPAETVGPQAQVAPRVSGLPKVTPENLNVVREIQIYGSAPQFTAFMIDGERRERLYLGATLVASIVYPWPVVGRDLRPLSGVAIYNRDIYGDRALDQVTPFKGELFWNFSYPGVVVGFVLVGLCLAWLDERCRHSRTALSAFMASYAGIWVSFLVVGSIASLSQVTLYFMWPFVAYGFGRWFENRATAHRAK